MNAVLFVDTVLQQLPFAGYVSITVPRRPELRITGGTSLYVLGLEVPQAKNMCLAICRQATFRLEWRPAERRVTARIQGRLPEGPGQTTAFFGGATIPDASVPVNISVQLDNGLQPEEGLGAALLALVNQGLWPGKKASVQYTNRETGAEQVFVLSRGSPGSMPSWCTTESTNPLWIQQVCSSLQAAMQVAWHDSSGTPGMRLYPGVVFGFDLPGSLVRDLWGAMARLPPPSSGRWVYACDNGEYAFVLRDSPDAAAAAAEPLTELVPAPHTISIRWSTNWDNPCDVGDMLRSVLDVLEGHAGVRVREDLRASFRARDRAARRERRLHAHTSGTPPSLYFLAGHGQLLEAEPRVVPPGCTLVVTTGPETFELLSRHDKIKDLFSDESLRTRLTEVDTYASRRWLSELSKASRPKPGDGDDVYVFRQDGWMPALQFGPTALPESSSAGLLKFPIRPPARPRPTVLEAFTDSLYPTQEAILASGAGSMAAIDTNFATEVHALMEAHGPGVYYFSSCFEGPVLRRAEALARKYGIRKRQLLLSVDTCVAALEAAGVSVEDLETLDHIKTQDTQYHFELRAMANHGSRKRLCLGPGP